MKKNPENKILGVSIGFKVAFVLLITTLLAIIITGAIYHYRAQNELQTLIYNHLKSSAEQQSYLINQVIQGNEDKIALITSRTQLRLSLKKWIDSSPNERKTPNNLDILKIKKILNDAIKSTPDFVGLSVFDLQGNLIATAEKNKQTLITKDSYLPKESNKFKVINENHRKYLLYSKGLFLKNQKLGVLYVKTNLDKFIGSLTAHTGLGDSETAIIYYNNKGKFYPLITNNRENHLSGLNIQVLFNVRQNKIQTVSNNLGEKIFVLSRFFPNLDWGLIFSINKKEALDTLEKNTKFLIIALFIAFFLVLIVALLLAKSITRPVINMAYIANSIAKGDLSKRIRYLSNDELGVLAKAFNNMADNLISANETLEQKIKEKTKDLSAANENLRNLSEKLKKLSLKDSLTNLANRRAFDLKYNSEWKRALRDQTPLSLVFGDVDYFKKYNDTLGHPNGDECLKKVGKLLSQAAKRENDFVARYGGEEFIIILPNTSQEQAYNITSSLQKMLSDFGIPHPNSDISDKVTISFGIISCIPQKNDSPEELFQQVDQALYQAKSQGRNRIVIY